MLVQLHPIFANAKTFTLNKNMYKSTQAFFLAISLIFTSLQLSAQVSTSKKYTTGKIGGKIIDAQSQQPFDFASVALVKAGDSSASTKGTYTNENGEFYFQKLAFGKYKIVVTFLGYETLTVNTEISALHPEVYLDDLKMKQAANKLKEVTVTAQRSPFQVGANGVTYNVEESLQNTGATAVEALQRIPSVQVDPDGNISVRGSSDIKVLIDGEPTELSKVLDMIPASALQKIEVITNPSAKYSAEGSGGIINIVTKNRAGIRGFNTSLGLNANTRNRYSGKASVNYSTRKFSIVTNYTFSPSSNTTSSELFRQSTIGNSVNYLNQLSHGNSQTNAHSFFSTSTYRFNTTNSLALNLSATSSSSTNFNSTLNSNSNSERIEYQNFTRNSSSLRNNDTYRVGLTYRKTFPTKSVKEMMERGSKTMDSIRNLAKENPKLVDSLRNQWMQGQRGGSAGNGPQIMGFSGGGFGGGGGGRAGGGRGFDFQNRRELKTEINYSSNNNHYNSFFNQFYVLPAPDSLQQQTFTNGNSGTISFKSDLTYPFNHNNSRLETGISSNANLNKSRYRLLQLDPNGNFIENVNRTNNFNKTDVVNAGYVSLTNNFGKLSVNAGLRLEQSTLNADLISELTDLKKQFLTLHPSFSLFYKVDELQSLRFAYSNRINRPGMDQLNPYKNETDTLNIRFGNINLDPSRGHTFELGYNRFTGLGSISSSLFYRRTNNMINSYSFIDELGVSYTTYANLGENISYGMDLSGNIMLFSGKLNVNMETTLLHNSYINKFNADFSREQYSFNANMDARLTLTSDWNIGSNLRYTGPQAFLQGRTEGFFTAGMDLKKNFMKRKFNITLSADDLFNTRNAARIISSSFTQNSLNKTTTRVIRLGFNYRFGQFSAGGGRGMQR
ncbi:TonB-dependent receptor domain-containing protein [Solitalea koreensis]|uniref:CarboxypepD_reg-like domain-containing protein n=1 Tax=Solitalea koreensis TaxID=543615 RepID=A0A521BYU4_9SPHI|nr:TonB-dependent receptor [Solitalea koreensis]SMO52359.1 CarboxypepD_reg-like domain-containing protein [Solitalea koreensis]